MPDVVIIGGGIIGAATAYELARSGVSVTLLERGHIAGQQSGRNWGFVRRQGRAPAELPLILAALDRWRTLEAELDADLGWTPGGCLSLTDHARAAARFRAWIPIGESFGVHATMPSAAEVAEIVPGLALPFRAALFCAGDGHADPAATTLALADRAVRHGAKVECGRAVTAVTTSAGRVTGVRTDAGPVPAGVVVCAAGTFSRRLLRGCGVDLPQHRVHGTVALTGPLPPVTRAAVWSDGLAFRQRPDGRLVVTAGPGGDVHLGLDSLRQAPLFLPSLWGNRSKLRIRVGRRLAGDIRAAARGRPLTDDTDDTAPLPDVRRVRRSLHRLHRALPATGPVTVEAAWAGVIDSTPDALPVIDRLAAPDGLVIATGFSGHGFGLGITAGQAVAALATGAPPPFDLRPFRHARFAERDFQPPHAII